MVLKSDLFQVGPLFCKSTGFHFETFFFDKLLENFSYQLAFVITMALL
jgi:hypothetical protein